MQGPTNTSFRVARVVAREVLDSRGNPTVQADVHTQNGHGRFTVPSGASKGRFEAYELRDGDQKRYRGLGVKKAIGNIENILGPAILGMDSREQAKVDEKLAALDGTERKQRLGANALLGVSMAVSRAAADTAGLSFHKYLLSKDRSPVLPVPHLNILNGGKHAGNDLSFQEFMVLPVGFKTFSEALRAGSEVYHTLGQGLSKKYGRTAVNVGDEGGYAPPLKHVREALEFVSKAIEEAGYSSHGQVFVGIDPASGSFYDTSTGAYKVDGKTISTDGLFELYEDLCKDYPLRSIEDPFQDEDYEGFSKITRRLGSRVQIVGDDLFVTNSKRLEKGVKIGAANALLVKVNQAGTLTEALDALEKARDAGYGIVVSHRSGDTEDATIADLAVGLAAGQIKTGAPARGERTAKYNRLLQIEEELGREASYFGPKFAHC